MERSAGHRLPRARAHRAHDLGTAVNVQAMVFGNRDDNSGTGVGFTRNAATGENKPYGDFLVNAQGEDVVAGHPQHRGPRPHEAALPGDPRRAAGDLRSARSALPRHVRHRVHDRPGQALDAADPRRQAHRRRGAADGRRHDQGHRQGCGKAGRSRSEEALTRVTDEHLDAVLHPQFAEKGKVLATGLAASPGAAVGKVYFTADEAADAAEARREGHPRAQRDQPRRRARHDGRRGHPHRPRWSRVARRRRRPWLGHARPSSAPKSVKIKGDQFSRR